jgi:hypothetical protein
VKKKLLWILAGFLGILILILIILPEIAKNYAEKHSKKYIGRKFTIEKVRLNYFTSTLRINGFKLYEADEKEIFASFDELLINIQPLNLLENELVIEQLNLQGLYTNIIQKDSTFNFDDIIAFFNKPADSTKSEIETDTTDSELLRFRMSDFNLAGAHIIYDDRNVGQATHLRDFSFNVPYVAWNQDDKSEAGLRFNFAQEGFFKSSLKIDPINGDYLADVTIERLHLEAFREYIAYYTNIETLTGIFSSQIDLAGNIYKPEESLVSGMVEIFDLALSDTSGTKILGTDKISLGLNKIDFAHSRYEFDSLILDGLYVKYILNDSTDNLSEMFSSPDTDTNFSVASETDSTSLETTDSLYYSLSAVIINKGVIDYTDNLTGEPFEYHLDEIEMETDSIASDGGWVELYSEMMLNKRGRLSAQVGFDPADPMNNISLDYVISDFQLSDLNIYSRFYMGFPILMGDMYYLSETSIIKGILKSENKLVMTNVELGKKGGGIYDVPVKLALFILKDRNGVINLDVPVRGDLNDPKVRLGRIIWNTFKNLIVKVAAAPFDALAGQLNADPKDLESIEFDFLDTALTAQRQHQLDLLLELEKTKVGLGIELQYYNDNRLESKILAEKTLIEDETLLLGYVDVLTETRFKLIEAYLHNQNDSTQVKVSVSNPNDPGNLGTRPVFRILYSLKDE